MKTAWGIALLLVAQIIAWFQSNSGIIGGKLSQHYILFSLTFGPIVSVLFAMATKTMYDSGISLWSIRFLAFGMGYAIFIPLTWYFLGEPVLTYKNGISFILCLALILTQAFVVS